MSNPSGCEFTYIGRIRTPYREDVPYQAVPDDEGEFHIEVDPTYADGLRDLDRFTYAYVLFHIDRLDIEARPISMSVAPPWAGGRTVGLFASRSPMRPNPIGLSIVRVLQVEGGIVRTSGIDVLDKTPVLDIKPYIDELDAKPDANLGWVADLPASDHLALHIKGIPHEY